MGWGTVNYDFLITDKLRSLFLDTRNIGINLHQEYIPVYEDYLDVADYLDDVHPDKMIITVLTTTPTPYIFNSDGYYLEMLNLILTISALTILYYFNNADKLSNSKFSYINQSTQTDYEFPFFYCKDSKHFIDGTNILDGYYLIDYFNILLDICINIIS